MVLYRQMTLLPQLLLDCNSCRFSRHHSLTFFSTLYPVALSVGGFADNGGLFCDLYICVTVVGDGELLMMVLHGI